MNQPALPTKVRLAFSCESQVMRFCIFLMLVGSLFAQTRPTGAPAPTFDQAVQMAENGRCQEAMPVLSRSIGGRGLNRDLLRRAGFAGVRCGMTLNAPGEATRFLDWLNHEFPRDPEVLFLAVHVYSDLSLQASQELLATNPGSVEVHLLNAESLEQQGEWKKAMEEYRTVLARQPRRTGIHYQIGRLILSQPKTDTTFRDATAEFEAELRNDPGNPGAHYVLGEIARQQDQFPQAVEQFTQATKLDPNFADAFTGLGRSLLSEGHAAEAVAPLQRAAAIEPNNPTAHYYAAMALQRAGRRQEADQERQIFQRTSAAMQKQKDEVKQGIMGPQQIEPGK